MDVYVGFFTGKGRGRKSEREREKGKRKRMEERSERKEGIARFFLHRSIFSRGRI